MDPQLAQYRREQQERHAKRQRHDVCAQSAASGAPVQLQPGQPVQPQSPTARDLLLQKQSPAGTLRLLTWNVDGLDHADCVERLVHGVIDTIVDTAPTVVFLQELVPDTVHVLRKFLCNASTPGGALYDLLVPDVPLMPYFCGILLQRGRISPATLTRLPFPTTKMGRELLTTHVTLDGRHRLHLATAHLESQKDSAEERKRQLAIAVENLLEKSKSSAPAVDLALFGGDLNLRDAEAKQVLPKPGSATSSAKGSRGNKTTKAGSSCSGSPRKIHDCWELAGSCAEHKFTWDLQRCDNVKIPGAAPRCRFDRLYAVGGGEKIKRFELVGTKRLESNRRFPSDHFGILAEFVLSQPTTASTDVSRPDLLEAVVVDQTHPSGATSSNLQNNKRAAERPEAEADEKEDEVILLSDSESSDVPPPAGGGAPAPDPELVSLFVNALRGQQMQSGGNGNAAPPPAAAAGPPPAAPPMGKQGEESGPNEDESASGPNRHKSPFCRLRGTTSAIGKPR